MANAGFFEQKSASPTRFALVAAGHALVLGAVMLAAGPQFTRHRDPPIIITPIPIPEPPPPDQPRTERVEPQMPVPRVPIPIPDRRPDLTPPPPGPQAGAQPSGGTGSTIIADPPPQNPPTPIRRGAELDPRFASALQPQYPASEQRAGRTGTVVIRVTIGTDGRVRDAERVSATSDAFWAAAERQALSRWRFRPATVDGRPVESSRVMTIHFRIADV
jgi:protein TonB